MNMQAYMSGQISGQVPNQGVTQLSGLPQQNGNTLPTQIQNLGGFRSSGNMDEFPKIRKYMQEKIFEFLVQRQARPNTEVQRLWDIVKRLEEALFRSAQTKEEYSSLDTLENRLQILTKRITNNNHNQQYPRPVNYSSGAGTMIPTPGMPHGGSSNMMASSSVDTSIIAASGSNNIMSNNVNTGGPLVGMHGGSFNSSDGGSISNGYQQTPSSFSIGSAGNNMMSSMSTQRITSQMIPTPGFSTNTNQSYVNLESSSNGGGFSSVGVEPTMVSQQQLLQQHQKQQFGGNSRILHSLGSQMGSGIRSGLQQKPYGFSNGAVNGGLGMIGGNMQMVNGPGGTSEGYLTTNAYPPKALQQHIDPQNQGQLMQGDGFGMGSGDLSGSGNFYGSASVGTMMNNQNLNPVSLQSIAKTNSSLLTNQTNLHGTQHGTHMKPQAFARSEKMNLQAQHSLRENLLQPHEQQLQQQSHLYQQQQQQQQYAQMQQRQQKQQNQQHHPIVKTEAFSQSHLTSSDLGNQVKPELGMESHNEVFHPQVSEPFQLPELHNQFQVQQNSADSQFSLPSGGQPDICRSLSQNSQQMQQLMHQHQLAVESQNDFGCISSGPQLDTVQQQGQWHPQSQDRSLMLGNLSNNEQQIQDEFRHRIIVQDEAQRNNLSSDGSFRSNGDTINLIRAKGNLTRERQLKNQQRWLLFIRHARKCPAPEGKCLEAHCILAQKLLWHLDQCNGFQCTNPRCGPTKSLLKHHKECKSPVCPVCIPVMNFCVQQQLKEHARPQSDPGLTTDSSKSSFDTSTTKLTSRTSPSPTGQFSEDLQSSLKRMKMEPPPTLPLIPESKTSQNPVPSSSEHNMVPHLELQQQTYPLGENFTSVKPEVMDVDMEFPGNSSRQGSPNYGGDTKDKMDDLYNPRAGGEPIDQTPAFGKQEHVKLENDSEQPKQENVVLPAENAAGTKSGKPKIKGVSLIELFTPEQVREHIIGLRQWVGQSKSKVEKNQAIAMDRSNIENCCQLCQVEKLTFEPPPIYCTPCGCRIKRNAMYYTVGTGETRHFFCISCHNDARGDTIIVDGNPVAKSKLEKKKNDEETEEWWVQCDKCEAWQHQICALFNGRRNDGGQAEYTCPNCYTIEIERGERKPLPQSAVLGAKDLPRTILSDHIEQRLFRRLKTERLDRARLQGKSYDEVPGAESLVVRVVSSVDKKLDVKQRFLEIFQEDNYPTEFPYKSKVVLLFQKIEGVEVCLFGMYVQEFGSECLYPNQRRVYLSYLDSVKYFRPEIKAVTGEALRTFVYHEILIGYLEYCKKRGFTSCYIWACPPLKGEDYILYCHPEIQKTPKSDKLREWYLAMLRKAIKENIVVDLTNLYDHFFMSTGECKAKVTASRLPYFDGDYWPGAAEDMIYQLRQEEDGRKLHKKGTTKKTLTKRALKASGQSDLSGNASKDLLLMHKLGDTISPMKEDFIMVHLQHACSHCCNLMVSGRRWDCKQCKQFKLCDKCYDAERKLDDRERHPTNMRDKHELEPIDMKDVPLDTKDKDDILESEFFDTRQAFLSLCQGNHYQYDTLRRAKHSSMMVLYHLHNPTAPAFVSTCNKCHLDIETGQGWRCEICPDYDVCNPCYQKHGGNDHPHKLTNHPSTADRDAQNKEARQQRVVQLRKMLDLLVHASICRSPMCQYPNCRKVKCLFRHGIHCRTRASGGCNLCKKMWYLLQLHARACKVAECHVPRCKDLKEHVRRLQQQSDSRRRAAVMEMMRQRAAEVHSNS